MNKIHHPFRDNYPMTRSEHLFLSWALCCVLGAFAGVLWLSLRTTETEMKSLRIELREAHIRNEVLASTKTPLNADRVCPAWLFQSNAASAKERVCKGGK